MGDIKIQIPNYIKFINGGLAGMMATSCVQPMDVVKNQMQIDGKAGKKQYNNSLHCVQKIMRKQGISGLYKGMGAGLLRQATYTTSRLGVYTYLVDRYRRAYGADPTVVASMTMAIAAGTVGAFVGTPAEVSLVRMVVDGQMPHSDRRNYKNVADAITRIAKEEGVFALWRGCIPTVGRAIVVNVCQLASYSQFKALFKDRFHMKEGLALHTCGSSLSGFLTTIASMPLDIAKTRIQNMKMINGKGEYSGVLDVVTKIVRNEGPFALWRGFTPYFLRICPHTIFTFIFLENLNKLYTKFVLGEELKGSSL